MNGIRHGFWQGWTAFALLAMFFFSPSCLAQLPDFVDLVRENRAAVVNISTRQQFQQYDFLPEGLDPGQESLPDPHQAPRQGMPEGTPGHPHGQPMPDPFGKDGESLGSGFIIGSDGIILTNDHVTARAQEIIVRLSDGRELEAEVIGADERTDLAVLQIDAESLPTVSIGSGEDLAVGEWVLAIGSPFGFEHSVTSGIVSAKGRSLPHGNYVPYIQTDVAINPGNSGGPLFNLDGEVVGINSQIYSRTGGFMGLSFAIPIELAMEVAEQLQETGQVQRGWLGVMIQDVTRELAAGFGLDRPYGALVAELLEDGPAADAGIKSGDVILEFAGRSVDSSAALPPIVGRAEVGSTVEVVVLRDGEKKSVEVDIKPLPDDSRIAEPAADDEQGNVEQGEASAVGIRVEPLREEERSRLDLEKSDGGVLVTEVSGQEAIDAGFQPGDILVTLDHQPVSSAEEFATLAEDLESGSSVPVLVIRDGQPSFLALQVP
ncbi:HtrA protease/chaperone protein [Halorhodospira halochloris]|uniref:Probable periplasmic serine endoprotease DegP-like n=1 Tax=Halorhodospira halochloris TaxID=1052 RepID=A0A125T2P8_HALHR|nr:Do family serine endopeptidase [Halorhodospira halochloris]MBK1652017.1 serine peptidase [Halorhodospira halochloris]BAU58315.1 HtrA protease/chaperone protein [Halorhodospira halochloris]